MRSIKYQVCSQQDVNLGDFKSATSIDILTTKDSYLEAEEYAINLPKDDGEGNFMRKYYYENIFIRKVYEL